MEIVVHSKKSVSTKVSKEIVPYFNRNSQFKSLMYKMIQLDIRSRSRTKKSDSDSTQNLSLLTTPAPTPQPWLAVARCYACVRRFNLILNSQTWVKNAEN